MKRDDAADAAAGQDDFGSDPALELLATEGGPLHSTVHSFYRYRNPAASIDGVERVDIGQIRFILRGKGLVTFADGHSEPSRPVMIKAPALAASTYHVDGPFHCFGVTLRALGWKSLIGIPAHRLSNRIVDGAELFGPAITELLDRLRGLDSLDAMVAEVSPFLLARRRPVPRSHIALVRAVREWAATDAPTIAELFRMVPMGERQATRLCNEYFGGPPKHLERKFRAIRAAIRIVHGASNADASEPYADQSHMIKDVKRYTGHTPSDLRDRIDPVVDQTLRRETFQFLPDVIPESVDDAFD